MKTALIIQKSDHIYIVYELLSRNDGFVEMDAVDYRDYPELAPFRWRSDIGKYREASDSIWRVVSAAPSGICRALSSSGFRRIMFVSKNGDGNPDVVRMEG